MNLIWKRKGAPLSLSSHDFTYIVSGSEDKYVYIWSTYHDLSKFSSVRRDRNDFWEGVKGKAEVPTPRAPEFALGRVGFRCPGCWSRTAGGSWPMSVQEPQETGCNHQIVKSRGGTSWWGERGYIWEKRSCSVIPYICEFSG